MTITLPASALVVLCGVSASGKTTFAKQNFSPTQIISSDALRAMVADDEADQTASAAAFSLLYSLIRHRLARRLLTVVDSTALRRRDRQKLLQISRAQGVPAVAIVFSVAFETCLARNAARDRKVPEAIMRRQQTLLEQTQTSVQSEGFDEVRVIDAQSATVEPAVARAVD